MPVHSFSGLHGCDRRLLIYARLAVQRLQTDVFYTDGRRSLAETRLLPRVDQARERMDLSWRVAKIGRSGTSSMGTNRRGPRGASRCSRK